MRKTGRRCIRRGLFLDTCSALAYCYWFRCSHSPSANMASTATNSTTDSFIHDEAASPAVDAPANTSEHFYHHCRCSYIFSVCCSLFFYPCCNLCHLRQWCLLISTKISSHVMQDPWLKFHAGERHIDIYVVIAICVGIVNPLISSSRL